MVDPNLDCSHLLDAIAFGYGAEPLSADHSTGWVEPVNSSGLATGLRLAQTFL